jgi:hypothetical protein
MKHLIMSLLLLTGMAADAQNFAKFERGDTTFYFLPDYFDQFDFLAGTESMDVGHVGERVYTFKLHRATKTVYAVPVSNKYPAVAMTYPRSHHTHKHEAYTKTQDYRDLQEWVHKNEGRRNVIW